MSRHTFECLHLWSKLGSKVKVFLYLFKYSISQLQCFDFGIGRFADGNLHWEMETVSIVFNVLKIGLKISTSLYFKFRSFFPFSLAHWVDAEWSDDYIQNY